MMDIGIVHKLTLPDGQVVPDPFALHEVINVAQHRVAEELTRIFSTHSPVAGDTIKFHYTINITNAPHVQD